MKSTVNEITLSTYENFYLVPFTNRQNAIETLETLRGKQVDVEFKKHSDTRSNNANKMMWALVGKIAEVLTDTKDNIYIKMLKDYGQNTHIIVKPDLKEQILATIKYGELLGDVLVNGSIGTQIKMYIGSSQYTTHQMAKLIDGVIYEAKELGIEVLAESEVERLKAEWGNKKV